MLPLPLHHLGMIAASQTINYIRSDWPCPLSVHSVLRRLNPSTAVEMADMATDFTDSR